MALIVGFVGSDSKRLPISASMCCMSVDAMMMNCYGERENLITYCSFLLGNLLEKANNPSKESAPISDSVPFLLWLLRTFFFTWARYPLYYSFGSIFLAGEQSCFLSVPAISLEGMMFRFLRQRLPIMTMLHVKHQRVLEQHGYGCQCHLLSS